MVLSTLELFPKTDRVIDADGIQLDATLAFSPPVLTVTKVKEDLIVQAVRFFVM